MTALFCCCTGAAPASTFDFLSVSGNNVPGNAASTTFTSNYANGVIKVTHVFPFPTGWGGLANGWGTLDNINSAIFPSAFPILFPGTGTVQGHLAMTMYGDLTNPHTTRNPSTVTFDLTGYTGNLPALAFGIWNTTDEVNQPAYNVQFRDSSGSLQTPLAAGILVLGNEDNVPQVLGRHKEQLNLLTGDITCPTPINGGNGVHTDALFLYNIPTGYKEIVVTAQLDPLNTSGDGVGYYFAEPVPEPSTFVLLVLGLTSAGAICYRRMRALRRPSRTNA
jgi:hypothetical protein